MIRRFALTIAAASLIFALAAGNWIIELRSEAALMRAKGRLKQLHLAVANYELKHGTPFGMQKNQDGQPTANWFVTLMPEFEFPVETRFDPAFPWDASQNRTAVVAGQPAWDWFSGDDYFPMVLNGENSAWNQNQLSGKKLLECSATDILFVAICETEHHPAEPTSVDATNVARSIRTGDAAVFVDTEGNIGSIHLVDGHLTYDRD